MTTTVRRVARLAGALVAAAQVASASEEIGRETLDRWSAPYRGWTYYPDHVIPAEPKIAGHETFHNADVPCVYQLPDKPDVWYMSFIAFDGKGYNSFVAESADLVRWGVAVSDDGLVWRRAKETPILAVQDADCVDWEKDCVYQPWLVEHLGRFFDFYNAACGGTEQTGVAFSTDLLNWMRYPANPVVPVRAGGYDEKFASDPKVFRDGDHWTMFYFGVGRGGAHVMVAFSRDLVHWTAHPEPLYKAGGHPGGLDKQYAHKISLVRNPKNDTFYLYYCACGNKGRGIGLLTSKPLP